MINKDYLPKLYKSTANMTLKEWEEERKNSIGGSDMAVLLGLNHFGRTKRDLYYDKTGVKPVAQDKGNEYKSIIFNSGHFLEEMVADIFSYRTGLVAYEIKAMFEHPLYPFIRGNIDRFYRRKNETDPIGFLECKTTAEFNRNWSDNAIPADYIVQISTYLSILNMDHCKISCLFIPESLRVVSGILYQLKNVFGSLPKNVLSDIKEQLNAVADDELKVYIPTVISALGGEFLVPKKLRSEVSDAISDKLIIRDFERDEKLEEAILEVANDFWFNNVIAGIEPSLEGESGEAAIACLSRYTKEKKSTTSKMLSEDLIDNIKRMDMLKTQKSKLNSSVKEIDKEIEKLSVPIIEALDGVCNGTIVDEDDKFNVSYKTGNPSYSVPKKNLEKLKNSYPEAYADCIEERASKPKLSIKAV